jgi:hypothetical protein
MFPYGFETDKIHNYEDLTFILNRASEEIFKIHGKSYKVGERRHTVYPTSGGLADWTASIGVEIPITFELRPGQDNIHSFMLPADEIIPTGEETLVALLSILKEARKLGYYDL